MQVLSSFPLIAKALQLALQAWRKIPETVSRCPVCILSHAEESAIHDLPSAQAAKTQPIRQVTDQIVLGADLGGKSAAGHAHHAALPAAERRAAELEAQAALEVALGHEIPVQLAVGQHHILEVQRACCSRALLSACARCMQVVTLMLCPHV